MSASTLATAHDQPAAGDSSRLAALIAEVCDILNVEQIDADTPVIEIGIDSVNVVEIMLACETIYGVPVVGGDVELDQYTTLRDLDRQLQPLAAGPASP